MTNRELQRQIDLRLEIFGQRLAGAIVAYLRQRTRKRRANLAPKKKQSALQRALATIGTRVFTPSPGLYPAVAKATTVNRRYVYAVAKGMRTSPRVMKALRDEIKRRNQPQEGVSDDRSQ
jgi:hypothetical protein